MKTIGMVLALIVVLMGIQSWHQTNGTYNRPSKVTYRGFSQGTPAANVPSPLPTVTRKPTDEEGLKLAHADALRIISVAKTYGVPEGALFGHWMMESRGLREGWAGSERWILAKDLARADSKCAEKYDAQRCADRWQALRALCGQKVGERVMCDPNEVRTTYGMAMGPLQHMPLVVLRPRDEGGYTWASQAVDHDGDGFRNPFDADDALAWTALEIKKHYDRFVAKGEANPWRAAVVRYAGNNGKDHYYDGRIVNGKPVAGVSHYWTAWQQCRKEGTCPAVIARLRTR